MNNVQTVEQVYQWFSAGNAQAIIAAFDPGIEFRLAQGHPYRGDDDAWTGPDEVVRNFFMKAGPEWEEWSMEVTSIHSLGDVVVVEGRYHGLYKPTSRRMDVEVCHVWRFRDGKIAMFHQYVDTAGLRVVMGQGV
jgi:ketosteroid isomerase-like protein